jgi:DNA-binding beta-propeller fold protein YncE
VADAGNHLLRRIDLIRHEVTTMAGTGEKAQEFNVPGYGRGVSLNSPWDLYRQGTTLYMAMAGMHQIWRLDLRTAYAEPFAGSGSEALIDAPHLEAALGQPSGLSGDGQRLYVADSEVNAIRAVDLNPDGVTATLAGGGLLTFGDRDGVGAAGRMQHPLGVAYADGVIYVADTYNHKIKHLNPQSGRLQTLAGTGRAGYRDGPAAEAQFYEPGGMSTSGGKIYVADTNNHCVRVIDLPTLTITTLPLHGLAPPEITQPSPDQHSTVMQLTEQSLPAASPTTLHLDLRLPAGWEVNEQAPATLTIAVTGDGLRVPATSTRQTLLPLSPHQSVSLHTAQEGTRAWLRVDLAFVACRQSLCVPRQVAWEVPVRSQTGVTSSDLILHYRMPSL